ncbi:hypothetical protein [Catellatospora sp. NPDC049133]|uniref:hypothetical protein n=1 Tax=Catellatospora sp. NPDC049133 TaxID=3155499 RepID=UPI0033D6D42A
MLATLADERAMRQRVARLVRDPAGPGAATAVDAYRKALALATPDGAGTTTGDGRALVRANGSAMALTSVKSAKVGLRKAV